MDTQTPSTQDAIDQIDLIERYPDRFHRGEILTTAYEAAEALDGLPEVLQDDAGATAAYLRLITEKSDRFSDGDIYSELMDARRILQQGLSIGA